MSDKVRIHELAKKYGMPGKDLAAKLRENGFSQAKSHMSALDMIEQVQAEGLLAAIGITPVDAAAPAAAPEAKATGGVLLRRKKKKSAEPEEAPTPAPEPVAPPVEDVTPAAEAMAARMAEQEGEATSQTILLQARILSEAGRLDEHHAALRLGHRPMLDALGHHQHLPLGELDRAVAELHRERALQHEEHLVLLGVAVPVEGADELRELHLLAVQGRDDSRRPVIGEELQLVGKVDGVHAARVSRCRVPRFDGCSIGLEGAIDRRGTGVTGRGTTLRATRRDPPRRPARRR